jgi:hypothetical protein
MRFRLLSVTLCLLMAVQAALGLALRGQYRDAAWVQATWFANDWVTLLVAVPTLAASLAIARRGSVRAQLVWYGLLAYAVYNYAYYLFGAALNAFLPLYVVLLLLAACTLGIALVQLDASGIAARFRPAVTARIVAAYCVVVAVALAIVWLGIWAAHVFGGRPTPVEPEAFRLVAALDLTLMVPALAAGGILLWRRHPWGYVLTSVATVQATLYLLVLSAGSIVSIARGLVDVPGEVPIWGTLMVLTGTATTFLLTTART